ncbi:recombination mediator RecR [Marinoscillum furvescens]|uniref:Recombination protein RecR n=1 Tax=Marinoscillum furvescens DSM 4134 TaxID=1122208 RepID=A0A3D9L3N7_MARFU|nr:recombination mediator RecR [Marinoscillum furvescens]RED99810.1 DNA replication and repair protein RecR [Marinoscillum furvescens DSM 4134]
MEYPSKLVEQAVEEISRLPGIGKKTALRLALHLLKQPESQTAALSESLKDLREQIKYCQTCHIIADTEDCTCQTPSRDTTVICVVEDTPDVLAIRNTGQYNGLFHVLGGRISPMDGIGPDQVKIDSLIARVKQSGSEVKEVILALSSTMEGDTTAFYITKMLKETGVKVSTIARGIPVGGELEYTDELTLGRSIATRTLFSAD